jgi:predicted nuclease of predicted toxin-antitoxin system
VGLRLYADECVDGRIAAGLRRRGVDVVTAAYERLLGASDERHMEQATALGRVMLTADEDFFAIVRDRFARRVSFPGLIFLKPHTSVGRAIRAIVHTTEAIDPDARDWVKWLP